MEHFNEIRRAMGLGIEASPNVSRLSYYSLIDSILSHINPIHILIKKKCSQLHNGVHFPSADFFE